jgi:hypothetical protein
MVACIVAVHSSPPIFVCDHCVLSMSAIPCTTASFQSHAVLAGSLYGIVCSHATGICICWKIVARQTVAQQTVASATRVCCPDLTGCLSPLVRLLIVRLEAGWFCTHSCCLIRSTCQVCWKLCCRQSQQLVLCLSRSLPALDVSCYTYPSRSSN